MKIRKPSIIVLISAIAVSQAIHVRYEHSRTVTKAIDCYDKDYDWYNALPGTPEYNIQQV